MIQRSTPPARPQATAFFCQWNKPTLRADGRYVLTCKTPGCRNRLDGAQTPNPVCACQIQPPGVFAFGNLTHRVLGKVGLTDQLVNRVWLRVFGKPCGCKKRRSRWNRFGWLLYYRIHVVRYRLRWLSLRWWLHQWSIHPNHRAIARPASQNGTNGRTARTRNGIAR